MTPQEMSTRRLWLTSVQRAEADWKSTASDRGCIHDSDCYSTISSKVCESWNEPEIVGHRPCFSPSHFRSPTACVSGNWGESSSETESFQSSEKCQKRGAYQPSGSPGVVCRGARCVGRFLPFAIYSQTDSPQECQSNEKYYETNAHAGTL
jgi:hypothetical protein